MTTTASAPPEAAPAIPAGRRERLRQAIRAGWTWCRQIARLGWAEHRPFVIMLGAGAVLRLLVMIAYRPALWFAGDSGVYIRHSARLVPPVDPYRPTGYTLFVKLFRPTQTLMSVVAFQHLLGLAIAVAVYVFLLRRGLPKWLGCLATVPLLYDSLQVTLEHYILVETFFTGLILAGFLVVLWRDRPSTKESIAAGFLLFMAWFTKPLALPLLPILGIYLLLRRVGWRPLVGFALAFLVPYAIVQVLVSGYTSVYGSNSSAIYGRAAMVADCERIELPPTEQVLCPTPEQRGQRPDWYIWSPQAPGSQFRGHSGAYPLMRDFAIDVIRQQPGDVLAQVGKETAAHFVPGIDLGPSFACLRGRYSLPASFRDTRPFDQQCHAQLALPDFRDMYVHGEQGPEANPLTTTLSAYSSVVRTSPIVNSLGVLLAIAALFLRRRAPWPVARDALLFGLAGAALIIAPTVVGMYEARYALPALPLMCIAAALGARTLWRDPSRPPSRRS